MNAFIPYIVFGLTTGAVYGISAMGLVLTYKTSGLFNFGHGAVCAAAAFVFYALRQQHHVPWPLAALGAVLVFGALSGLALERIALVLSSVHTSFKIVGTVGILVSIQALAGLCFGPEALPFKPFLGESYLFHVQDVGVSTSDVVDVLLGIGAAVALYLFFKRTRLGTAMRGVVDDAQLLDMSGTAPTKVRRTAWVIGSVFAAASGVLFAATQQQLDVNILSLLVVQAFGAAAIARFSSLPMCLVGGLLVGVLQQVASKEVGSHTSLQGLDINVPFIVLFVVLLVIPRGKLAEVGRQVKARAVMPSPFTGRTRLGGYLVLSVGALLVPHVVGAHLPLWITAMTQFTLFLSLSLLVRTSGQISLCHVGFAAIGAAGFGHMYADGAPWAIAILLGGLFAIPAGALVAIPAIRLSGLFLGLATLGFGILLAEYAYNKTWMFGGALSSHSRRPAGFTSDTRFYYVLLAIAGLALGIVALVERSRLGRLLRGLADAPIALTTLGTNVNVSRVLVFCLSTFLAGVSGATFASEFSAVNQESFNYVESLIVLAVMAISGRRTLTVAVVAPLLLYVVPGYISNPRAHLYLQLGFGVAAVFAAAISQGALARLFSKQGAQSAERLVDPIFRRGLPSRRASTRTGGRPGSGVWVTRPAFAPRKPTGAAVESIPTGDSMTRGYGNARDLPSRPDPGDAIVAFPRIVQEVSVE
ncbi:MAG: ABC transporter permease [Actinomycetota bacterium]|nr:ABC transporter permease [Actinomycetota bacterium]